MIARRMEHIDASGIRKVFDKAAQLEDPINLSIGQPDFSVPEPVKEAAIDAIRNDFNRYTVTQGIPELHDAIRAHLKRVKSCEPEALLVTSGVSGGLLLAFLVLVDPGDEVAFPDPYFVMYKHLVRLAGGVPRYIDTYPDFRLRRDAINAALSPKTKLIVINSPANPTGAVYSSEELELVAEIAAERGLLVISDEIYDLFSYDGPCPSMAPLYDKTLLLGGFSKSHAMTGWRLGYAAGPAEVVSQMTKLQQFSFVCAPSFAQKAGVEALGVSTQAGVDEYGTKLDAVCDGLKDFFEFTRPGGAFYVFPKAPWGTGTEFCEAAIENNLLIIPGNVFSERDTHFRIAYAASMETIERGLEVLNRLARQGHA